MKGILYTLLFCFLIPLYGYAQRADQTGSKDYPMLNRMPDFFIRKYTEDQFAALSITTAKNETRQVEGKKIFIRYEVQKDATKPSPLQIVRNYSKAVEKAGGQIIYEHPKAELATYLIKTKADKQIWISLITAPDQGRRYTLYVLEEAAMAQDIVLDADLIKEKIELEGKVALYGILFDTGKSTIKEESAAALEQIGLYLKNNTGVNCWVVGHTDTDGDFSTNMTLSSSRAQAVKSYLESQFSIDPGRLESEGVGPLVPVATNSNEEGKGLNRRVELVKKP